MKVNVIFDWQNDTEELLYAVMWDLTSENEASTERGKTTDLKFIQPTFIEVSLRR